MPRFTKMNPNGFKNMTWDSGVVADAFNPDAGELKLADISWETTGDNRLSATRELSDMGAEINNCPENTMQLQKAQPWQAQLTGTAVSVTADSIAQFLGNADVSAGNTGPIKITPRNELLVSDFQDKWLIVNYSEFNGDTNGGFVAIHLMNSFSSEGMSPSFSKNANGKFPYTLKAYYDMEDMDKVPFEIYVQAGEAEPATQGGGV